ncbi:uncharacterized protein LOC142229734 [Haematobia irritans]|uniref:uncharacterized protein LOC142229734 n=1 Tax=Haematobia irritans TaxID=7368 RepID=UPI003F4F419A
MEGAATKPIQGFNNLQGFRLSPLTPGTLLFISAGMCLAQSIGWIDSKVSIPHRHFYYSWFIAVIVGSLISLPLRNLLARKFLMAGSSILILVGGILFVSMPSDYDTLIAGRYLNGIGIGLIIVPYLMHSSEISSITRRGIATGMEQFSTSLGFGIQMLVATKWNVKSDFTVNSFHGVLDIILAILSVGSLFYFMESPVDLIRLEDEAGALTCLVQMERTSGVTESIQNRLEELKEYVNSPNGSCIMPTLKMIISRSSILAFTDSIVLTSLMAYAMVVARASWFPIAAALLRIFGSSLSLLFVDRLGRKLPSVLWAIVVGALMIYITSIINTSYNFIRVHQMETVLALGVCIQFFSGLYAPNTSTYLSEAFPLKTKPFCMTICIVVQQIIQIVLLNTINSLGDDGSLMAMSIIVLVIGVLLLLIMPETKRTSLKEAQERFSNFFNFKML